MPFFLSVSFLLFLTDDCRAFYKSGSVVRCLFLLDMIGLFFFDVYGYIGSNSNPGKLDLTDQLFRFVFVEVDGACFGQLLTVACGFKAEPIKCIVFSESIGAASAQGR